MKITNVELQNTGGGCMVLYIEVEGHKYIKTIGLNDECIVCYEDTLSEIENGAYNESEYIDMMVGNPFKDLADIIGQANGQAVKQLYKKEYLEPTR